MNSDTMTRLGVAALIFAMVNAVTFGVGLVTVLSIAVLSQQSFFWIPLVVVASFVISLPLAWIIAPMLMQRFIQAQKVR